ncbi:hypothetical protein GCM10020254_09640 [Streptomyces goshikiensis]
MGEDRKGGQGRVAVEGVEEAQGLSVGHVEFEDDAVEGIGGEGRGGFPGAGGVDDLDAAVLSRRLVAGVKSRSALSATRESRPLGRSSMTRRRRAWRCCGRAALPARPGRAVPGSVCPDAWAGTPARAGSSWSAQLTGR